MKKSKKKPLKIKIDRAINPFDGSRRRLSSVAHKSKKHYSRKIKHKSGAFFCSVGSDGSGGSVAREAREARVLGRLGRLGLLGRLGRLGLLGLAVDIYKVVKQSKSLKTDFRFVRQITSSAVSIPFNITEGEAL